jgi:diguanylate cyclase (GGDEF)-like protein/PAS domain S-box-containing protein
MSVFSFRVVLFFCLALCIPQFASAALNLSESEKLWLRDHPVVSVGETTRFQPLFIEAADGSISGILPDSYDLIGEKLGIEFRYVADDWLSVLDRVQKGELDLVGAMNQETAQLYGFEVTASPVNFSTVAFAKKQRDFQLYKDTDLAGLRVAFHEKKIFIKRYLEQRSDEITLVPADSPIDAINLLLNDRADVVLGMNLDSYLLSSNALLEIEPVHVVDSLPVNSVIASAPKNRILLDIIGKAVAELTHDERSRILARWVWTPDDRLSFLSSEERMYLAEKPVLKVMNLNTFPPFSFYENNKPQGYTTDYLQLMAETLGVEIEFVSNKPWHEYLEMLKQGELDLIPHIAVTEERKSFVDYTNFDHIAYTTGFAVNSDVVIETAADLKDKVVAVANKTFLHSYLSKHYPDLKLLLTSSTSEAIQTVAQGRADAVIGSLPALNYYIQKNWLSNLRIAPIGDIELPKITQLPMGVAKGNHLLLSILEKTVPQLPSSKVADLKQKWMNTGPGQLLDAGLNDEERAFLRQKEKLNVCIDPNWMPLEGVIEGKHRGMTADYLAHFRKFVGLPMEFVKSYSWKDSLAAGKEGRCDLFSLIMKTSEREAYLDFSKPYMSIPLVLVTGINQAYIADLTGLNDKRIGIAEGFAIKPLLEQQFPSLVFVDVKDAQDGMRKVSRGELFGYADALPVVGYLIQQTYLGEMKVSGRFQENWELGLGTDKQQPLLNSIFNKAIQQISLEQHQSIQNRWISINYQPSVDYSLIWKLLAGFTLIAGLLLYRNRTVARLNAKLARANQTIISRQKMVDRFVLISTYDIAGHILSANRAFCEAMGYQENEVLGHQMSRYTCPDQPTALFDQIWAQLRLQQSWSGELKCATKQGECVYLNVNIEAMLRDSEVVGYRAISENITDQKRIEELSVTDTLTGLNNRLKIDELLAAQMERHERHGLKFSVLLLDVDNFKHVNDNFGHDVGDKLLKDLANVLKSNVRKIDTVGRWGGEEFVVICENTSSANAYVLAEKLRTVIAETDFGVVGQKTVSIGISELYDGDSLSTIFKRADQALYVAKHNGKNQVMVGRKQELTDQQTD